MTGVFHAAIKDPCFTKQRKRSYHKQRKFPKKDCANGTCMLYTYASMPSVLERCQNPDFMGTENVGCSLLPLFPSTPAQSTKSPSQKIATGNSKNIESLLLGESVRVWLLVYSNTVTRIAGLEHRGTDFLVVWRVNKSRRLHDTEPCLELPSRS